MDSATYRHLIGQLTNSGGIGHCNFPSHNLLSLDTLVEASRDLNSDEPDGSSEFLASFPCYQPFPYTARGNSVLLCGSGVEDHANELVKKKMRWERKLKSLRVTNINSALKCIRDKRQRETAKLTKELSKYIKHFHNDPEPMFSGSYNWLYTGGCLSCNEEPDGVTLIAADFLNARVGFNILKLNKTLDELQHNSPCYLKVHSPIFQITSKSHQENFIVCARQKKYINLFNIRNGGLHPLKLWRKKVGGSKLLTCVDIKDECEEIIVTDSSLDMHVFHVETRDKIHCYSGKRVADDVKDSWSQIAFGELGIYWAFKNCFTILDVRDFCSSVRYYSKSATSSCEEICSFVRSPNDSNFLYLGTTHSVLQLDLRMVRPVQRWTHLMKSPPQFMTSVRSEEGHELVVLQSHTVGEMMGIVNECTRTGDNVHFISKSLPCLLPSMKESLKLAHFHGLCLSPFVTKRVNFAVTGVVSQKTSQSDINLFATNSGGDVFQSKINKKLPESFAPTEEELVLETMKRYETHCETFPTDKVSGKTHLQFADMNVYKGYIEESKVNEKEGKKPEIQWKYDEMCSPHSLKFFKDVLAQKILKVWGYSFEESDLAPLSVDSKVREWIDKYTE